MFPVLCFGQNAKEIARKCMSSTVSIIIKDQYMKPISLGSGFILSNGKVVTNLHVIEEGRYGSVIISGQEQEHKIQGWLNVDRVNDLAILSVPSIGANSLQLSTNSNPSVGEQVYAIGNPQGLSGTISEGIISSIRKTTEKTLIQITAPISPGSSGGPVIDNDGKVIGVAVSTLASGQNLNFAIPSSKVSTLNQKPVTSINKLNFNKNITAKKTSNSEVDILDGISLKLSDSYTFSIRNITPYAVSNISIIMIAFDSDGYPEDYVQGVLLNEKRGWGNKFYKDEWWDFHRNKDAVDNYENLKNKRAERIRMSKTLNLDNPSTWQYIKKEHNFKEPPVGWRSIVTQEMNICMNLEYSPFESKDSFTRKKDNAWNKILDKDYVVLPYLAKKIDLYDQSKFFDFLSKNSSSSKIIYRVLDYNIIEI